MDGVAFWITVLVLSILCVGEPDILDGLIMQANMCHG